MHVDELVWESNEKPKNESLRRSAQDVRKEVAAHEIFVLDSDVGRDLAHRGTFHGRDTSPVTTLRADERRVWCILPESSTGKEQREGGAQI